MSPSRGDALFCCVKRSASRQNTVAFLLLLEEPDADKTSHSNNVVVGLSLRRMVNYNKALFDALTHAGVWEDDSQVKRMLVEWGPVFPKGKVEITITKFETGAGAAA
ncbi:RusA family crossover junction endodeoxyribonuclease [Salmonella enterica]|nr:RusA family crossover junction endodeoxyribonuclease [Salmonella enterica]